MPISLLVKRKAYVIFFIFWVNLFIYCVPSVINIFGFNSLQNEYKLIFGSFISDLFIDNKNELILLLYSNWIKLFSGELLLRLISLLKAFTDIIVLFSKG